jgi:DNA-binding beta-propeller fold protein YncE
MGRGWVQVVAGVGIAGLMLGLCVDSVGRWNDRGTTVVASPSPADPSPIPAEPDLHGTVVRIDAVTGETLSVVRVGENPSLLRTASGRPWTMNFGDGTLSLIDPETNSAATIDVGEVAGIASDGIDVWAAVDGRRIVKVEAETGEEKRALQVAGRKLFELGDAGFLAVDGDVIWLTVPKLGRRLADQSLWQIDPTTGEQRDVIDIGSDPLPPLLAGRHIWIVTFSRGLSRIDKVTHEEQSVEVGARPWGLAAGSGSLWVGDERGGVWLVDPVTAKSTALIPTSEGVRGVAVGGGRVWAATETGVVSINPSTHEIVHEIKLMDPLPGYGPAGIEYLNGDVWVSVD